MPAFGQRPKYVLPLVQNASALARLAQNIYGQANDYAQSHTLQSATQDIARRGLIGGANMAVAVGQNPFGYAKDTVRDAVAGPVRSLADLARTEYEAMRSGDPAAYDRAARAGLGAVLAVGLPGKSSNVAKGMFGRAGARAVEEGMAREVPQMADGVLSVGGRAIGRVKLDESNPAYIRLADIQLNGADQGQGHGSAYIRSLQERAAAEGRPIVLSTDAMRGKQAQERQRKLYEGLGFQKNTGPDAVGERIGNRVVREEYVWRP